MIPLCKISAVTEENINLWKLLNHKVFVDLENKVSYLKIKLSAEQSVAHMLSLQQNFCCRIKY